ncbi:antirestriction protein ArdA [Candidatus Enterococcus murrayae]|uniref:Antirestriction protein ArdA n=1 Tax=Candidatus Enterococcus murrayae TaxID=2815321 RepID=A0ABS3HCH7_9ENTE|nr:antirestriction protein ArdA [Enterococcus sp. MJM16]MBO0451149.1 antirestriction protein ArdA [Enterococcus sp. MJM16]
MEAQIYIANLSKYVSGTIQGGWFDLPVDYSDIATKLGLNESEEETIILDSDAPFTVTQYDSLDRLNELYEQYSELPSEVRDHAKELIGDLFSSEEDLLENAEDVMFFADVDTDEKLGSYWVDQGLITVPKELENYIDEEALGRDIRLDGQVVYVSDGCFMK